MKGFHVRQQWTELEIFCDGERLNHLLFAQANRAAVITNGGYAEYSPDETLTVELTCYSCAFAIISPEIPVYLSDVLTK